MANLLTIGGAHIDRTARLLQPHIQGASNPASQKEMVGGGSFNAARIAKLRGLDDIAMMSVRGGDVAAQMVQEEMEHVGISDFGAIFTHRATPSYTAILEPSGELITAIADMALYDIGFDRQARRKEGRQRIAAATHILVDANVPTTALEQITALAAGPIFAMAISPAKAVRLLPIADKIDIMFLNARELYTLTSETAEHKAVEELSLKGFKRAVISNGADAVIVLDHDVTHHLAVPEMSTLIDVTGAGDALAGATIASIIAHPNADFQNHVLCGIAAAQMVLQENGPVCEAVGTQAFDDALAGVRAAQKV